MTESDCGQKGHRRFAVCTATQVEEYMHSYNVNITHSVLHATIYKMYVRALTFAKHVCYRSGLLANTIIKSISNF